MRIIGNDQTKTRQTQAVASGALPNGKPVVVNADGTVSVAGISDISQSIGSDVEFYSGATSATGAAFDSANNKIIVVYKDGDNSSHGKAVVGTVSGTSISFGTPVTYNAANSAFNRCAFDVNAGKVVIVYQDNGNSGYGTAIVGTVSGTSISFGTEVVFHSGGSPYTDISYDSTNQQVVVTYSDQGESYSIKGIIGTVSGTSISFGSEADGPDNGYYTKHVYDPDQGKILVAFKNTSSGDGQCNVGTISGTTLSFGSTVTFQGSNTDELSLAYDTVNDKVIIAYDNASNSVGTAIVGTISGTSVSFGSPAHFVMNAIEQISVSYDATASKIGIFYRDVGNSNKGTYVAGTVSGTSITYDTPVVFSGSNASAEFSSVYDANAGKLVGVFQNSSVNAAGTSVVVQNAVSLTNLTAENFVGISGGVAEQSGSAGSTGSTNTFNSRTTSEIYSAYDANSNRVVVAYRDNGNGDNGTAVVGSISGTTITFGSPEIYHANLAQDNTIVFDSANNKVIISFIAWDNSNNRNGTSVVGTVSGTSISFGTPVQFNTVQTTEIASCFDSNSNKVVVAYRDISNSNYGTARVGTVSGTSISFGTEVVYESASSADNSIVFDSNSNKVVVAYYDGGNGTKGTAVVGTVSGTSISFGTPVVWDGGVSARHITTSFDTNSNKVVIAYVESSGNDIPKAIVGTVSGTSITFGTPVAYNTVAGDRQSMVYDANANRHVIFFSDEGDSYTGKTVSGLVSGTSISFTEKALVADGNTQHLSAAYDPDNQNIILSFDNVSNNYGVSAVHTTDTLSTTRGEVADGGNALLDTQGGVSENQIDLTAGQSYYVQTDGTISTTAGDPSVFAGTALSSTKLIVKG